MKNLEKNNLDMFVSQNKTKLDESLVSLRLMKEIDDFLEERDLSQREFAESLGYSEAFVSQLMSGTKKVNTSFINRIEKTFNLIIKFNIQNRSKSEYFSRVNNNSTQFSIPVGEINITSKIYTFQISKGQTFDPFTEL